MSDYSACADSRGHLWRAIDATRSQCLRCFAVTREAGDPEHKKLLSRIAELEAERDALLQEASSISRHTQKIQHAPKKGLIGDCHRTAIACLLGLSPEAVPHFAESDPDHAVLRFDEWLEEQYGLTTLAFCFDGSVPVEEVLAAVSENQQRTPFMLVGISKNGVNHCVIAMNKRIIHDPSIDQSGIVGPCDDGLWWVEFLAPIVPKRFLTGRIAELEAERDAAIAHTKLADAKIRALTNFVNGSPFDLTDSPESLIDALRGLLVR